MATLDANDIYTEFTLGESYDDQMDSNLNRLSRFGFHLSIKSRALTAPPGGEVAGDAYIPAATASGAWLSKEGQIAFHTGTAWVFGIPRRGWRVLIENEGPSGVGLLVARTATGTWATVGADGSAAVATHVGLADPHTQYATNTELTAHTGSTAAHDAANLTFTPTTTADWSGAADPGDVLEALDQLQAKASSKTTINFPSNADLTLTAAQANAAVIDITDTGAVLTAARNVIVPARPGAFDFVNSTARALTVKTAAGSGAVVPKGARWPLLVGSANVRNPGMATFIPFASFPAAAGNSGLVIGASDIGPAPGIELVSNGTRWRPRGGSQLLALRSDSPVTVQSLTEAIAETLSFVGGFVKAGDRLDLDILQNAGAISTGTRNIKVYVGAAASGLGGDRVYDVNHVNNAAASVTRGLGYLLARAGIDVGTVAGANGVTTSVVNNGWNPNPNFDNPWELNFAGTSVAENAETITSSSWAAGEVTFGYAATPSAKAVGDKIVVSGMTPSAYNGTYIVTAVPSSVSWEAALASDPGTSTVQGTSQRTSNVIIQGYKLTWSA